MSYSSTICRKCEKNTYVNLEDSGYLCASCIREINENQPSKIKKQHVESDDGVVHKSIRWLQSWFFADGVTSILLIFTGDLQNIREKNIKYQNIYY